MKRTQILSACISRAFQIVAIVIAVFLLANTMGQAQPGVSIWTNRYNGPGNHADQSTDVAVDSGGNVIVTGGSRSAGGSSSEDYATIKYSITGTSLWTRRYNGPGNNIDTPIAVAADVSGNVFVTGWSIGSSSANDYATIAYSSAGVPLWTNRYNGPGNSEDYAVAVVVDGTANVIVTGYSVGNGTGNDIVTIKYSNLGVGLWTNRYDGGNTYDRAQAIAADGSGNVFVAGYSTITGSSDNYLTIAYSSSGLPMWTNHYDGPRKEIFDTAIDQARAVAVDGGGNIFVTGSSRSGGAQDFATIKYSPAGLPLWTNRFTGPVNADDSANALAVDSNGNVFVTGSSWNINSSSDYATVAYSNMGVALWTNLFNGPANAGDAATDVAVDGSGNVFVTGTSRGSNNTYDYATIAYSNGGTPLWTNYYNGGGDDERTKLAVDSVGNVLITGTSFGNPTITDYLTIKYGPTVALQIERAGNDAVLIWANVAFGLQAAPSASGVFTNVVGATSPYTNTSVDTQRFFRLKGI